MTVEYVKNAVSRDELLENFVVAEANYEHVRSSYKYLIENDFARSHPNFETVLAEMAELGKEARVALEIAIAELLEGTKINFNGPKWP